MSNNTNFIRDYTRSNLVDDVIKVFPKLMNPITVPRSDGTFNQGKLLLSDMNKNQYFMFHPIYKVWLIQTYFFDKDIQLTYKFINIDDLEYSNFSSSEIQNIKDALSKGVRANLDLTQISPDFHPINHHYNKFKKMFNNGITTNSYFNENYFLTPPPPLKI